MVNVEHMQKWEYGTVHMTLGTWVISQPTGGFAKTMMGGQGIPMREFFDQHATPEGWELTGTVPSGSISLLIFRRPA